MCLTPEIYEDIFDYLFTIFCDDPANQWPLRWLSPRQKGRVEHYFALRWLPRLNVTSYSVFPHAYKEYTLWALDRGPMVIFYNTDQWPTSPYRLRDIDSEPPDLDPAIPRTRYYIRIGESGGLNSQIPHGYIISDVEPVNMTSKWLNNIEFNWHDTFTAVFREELLMRKITTQMISDREQRSKTTTKTNGEQVWQLPQSAVQAEMNLPLDRSNEHAELLKYLRFEIQYQRRIMVLKHRLKKNPEAKPYLTMFSEPELKQPYVLPPHIERHKTGDYKFSNILCPDICEMVRIEESMISSIPGWEDLSFDETLELRVDELAWQRRMVPRNDGSIRCEVNDAEQELLAKARERDLGILKAQTGGGRWSHIVYRWQRRFYMERH